MWNEPTQNQLSKLPRLYETEEIPLQEKMIHMHFFLAGCDWYIAEYDKEENLFWGYAILNGDTEMAEWGYISYQELKELKVRAIIKGIPGAECRGFFEVDRDVHWKPTRASEIPKIRIH